MASTQIDTGVQFAFGRCTGGDVVVVFRFVNEVFELGLVEDLVLVFVVETRSDEVVGMGTALTFRGCGKDVTTAVGVVGTSAKVGLATAAAEVANTTRSRRNFIVMFCRLEFFTFG